MEDVIYSRELVESMPTGSFVQEQIQCLRDSMGRVELERDEMLVLLHEIAEAEDIEELDELVTKVKEYVEQKAYPTPY